MLLLLAGCTPIAPHEVLRVATSAHLAAPPDTVFAAIADPRDEAPYRSERVSFVADGPLAPGTRYVETIDIALTNGYRMETEVRRLEPGRRVRLEATPRQDRHFVVDRFFLPEGTGTRFVSVIEADGRVVRDTARLPLPGWLVGAIFGAGIEASTANLVDAFAR